MSEQWELITSDERNADQVVNFIIFCEDEVSEPYYFNSFEITDKLKINSIPNQKQGKLNLDNTIVHCRNNGLIVFEGDAYKVAGDRNENIWCVYDRDMENTDFTRIREADHVSFDTAIQTATTAGINVAWSNDAFELWVLLHFEKVPTGTPIHRNFVYERLTAIFKTLHPHNPEFAAIVGHPQFYYKNILKKKLPFLTYVLPVMHSRLKTALRNAAELETKFKDDVPFHLRNPCTKVHHLVKQLISL